MMEVSTLDVRSTAGLLKALGDDTRLRIVALLSRGELCPCHIAAALDLGQPNTSQHLTVLRNAGVVDAERRGSWTWYRLTREVDPARSRILAAVVEGFTAFDGAIAHRRGLAAARTGLTCG